MELVHLAADALPIESQEACRGSKSQNRNQGDLKGFVLGLKIKTGFWGMF